MITIVDYGCGNLAAIANMLGKLGQQTWVATNPSEISSAANIILPGVGAFDEGMQKLRDRGMREVLDEKVLGERVPLLGICLGAQLICRQSEEGSEPGLNWVAADVVKFDPAAMQVRQKIPNMGWHDIDCDPSERLFQGYSSTPRFYFVHSFHIVCDNPGEVIATADHGGPFTAALRKDNVLGVQFHPEKSHQYGLQLFRNFLAHYMATPNEKS